MDQLIENGINMLSTYGGKVVLALVVLLIGHLLIKLLVKLAGKALDKTKLDQTVKVFAKKAVKILLYIVLIIGIIEILGVPMSSVVALLASCGLAVGLALQGALGNLAGGLMILVFKPFKIGDYVEASGAEGTVRDISIFYTTLITVDNKKIFVPNGDLMNANVTNFSVADQRRIDLEFKITNDIDAEQVKAVLLQAGSTTAGVLDKPAPFARMCGVDDDTYIFSVRVWCKTEEYWTVYFDLIENCSKALRDNNIDDPEERIAVRLVKDED
ncbi:MAG: mechanosensitive ion channel family protein [Eubacteriales bacterium]|nr:mechanosensitive ion channel family protein [Eubacteriales bacterium]